METGTAVPDSVTALDSVTVLDLAAAQVMESAPVVVPD
jgi:hypothetical protein